MNKLDFFTPIYYNDDQPKPRLQWLTQTVDSYFYLGGKKACVIPNYTHQDSKGVVLREDSPSFLIIAFKVSSYFTVILPIIMLIAKTALRTNQSFYVIDCKKPIEKEMEISDEIREELKTFMPIIRYDLNDPKIEWHPSRNHVFRLKSTPHLIFKMPYMNDIALANKQTLKRFENKVEAKRVCLIHDLPLICIPHARLIEVNGRAIIVEEYLNLPQNKSLVEEQYKNVSNEAIRQLATLIALTGLSDIEWDNIPVASNGHIVLVDLEHMDDLKAGLYGDIFRRGLIRCLFNQDQINEVKKVAKKHHIFEDRFRRAEKIRQEELEKERQLNTFYAKKEISTNPRLPIEIDDLEVLDLDLNETKGKREGNSLRTAVKYVIAKINEAIQTAPEKLSIKTRRLVLLDTNNDRKLRSYAYQGLDNSEKHKNWLRRIIIALVEKGYLFGLERVDGYGYLLQA